MTPSPSPPPPAVRIRLDLRGRVQGVGFRPLVYRLAQRHALGGFVANSSRGARIEIEGRPAAVAAFERDLPAELPRLARISESARCELPPAGERVFRIRPSETEPGYRPEVSPDAATCPDCLRELRNPADRRHGYPFINCTNCGPRYTIIRGVPYDRPLTTMAAFTMCADCAREYGDPADRRFHAQPNACPRCGPQVGLLRARDRGIEGSRDQGLGESPRGIAAAARLLAGGGIVAVKGLGGFHLACRADREEVVARLRARKLRDGKPLAVMVRDLATARRLCRLSPADEDALGSTAAPIVLAAKGAGPHGGLAPGVAPGCRDFGLMLPYSPLHHLLLDELRDLLPEGAPAALVMTSANLAGQPLTYRDEDALSELSDVADAFLLHDREIFRPVDDSVVCTFRDEVVPLRRARGYAPRPIRLAAALTPRPGPTASDADRAIMDADRAIMDTGGATRVLAVGGELKATVCLLDGDEAILSEHLGDLSNPAAYRHFIEAIERLKELCGFEPQLVACDLHPGYLSTAHARRLGLPVAAGGLGLPVVAVQHHHAHVVSVLAEWGEPGPVIGLSCDGTGYGADGAVWGGEVLLCTPGRFERVAHIAYYPLVGGDAAALETWRPAAALARAAYGAEWQRVLERIDECRHREQSPSGSEECREQSPSGSEERCEQSPSGSEECCEQSPSGSEEGPPDTATQRYEQFERQVAAGLNAPPTSSLGRVFDAAAYLLALCDYNRHEAEAAMAVEAAAASQPAIVEPLASPWAGEAPAGPSAAGALQLPVAPIIRDLVEERLAGTSVDLLAARFHESLARLLVGAATRAAATHGIGRIALSGGCFANRRLLDRCVTLVEEQGLTALYHRQVPCGDGGLSLGQAVAARHIALRSPP